MNKTQKVLLLNEDKIAWLENHVFSHSDDGDIIGKIEQEIKRAEGKFPGWPKDFIHGHAILSEECGEAQKEANHVVFGEGQSSLESLEKELVQTAAMAIRSLLAVKRIKGENNKEG